MAVVNSIIGALALLVALPAAAQTKLEELGNDGNAMLRRCSIAVRLGSTGVSDPADLIHAGYCEGSAGAIYAYLSWIAPSAKLCTPEGPVSHIQLAAIVEKYLREHPESLHEHGFVLVERSLREAWTCKEAE